MRTTRATAILAAVALLAVAACTRVPITGRQQLNLIPSSELNALSFEQYSQFLSEHRLSTDAAQTARVERVGRDIQLAVERFYAEQGQSAALEGYAWEFHLVEDDEVNAWCMPGGKVVVYTGLLPITQDATGLAVVMGHEIAHAIANHGGERMSQGMLTELGGMALQQALAQKSQETQQIFMTAFGIGSQVGVLLPYSRLHESEADHLGLIFMAMAGYDPEQAPAFWERMAAQNQGGAPPEFLSTHPSDETRLRKIRELIPEAKKYYRKG
jgi:predicted Zn-dependent protease